MTERDRFNIDNNVTLTPFWRRFPQFFLYPMQTGSLIRIVGYSLLVSFWGIFPFYLDLVFGFLFLTFFLRYALISMARTARGYFDEPNGIDDKDAGDWSQVAKLFLYLACLTLLTYLLNDRYGESGEQIGILLFNILAPAGVIIIVINGSFLKALDPLQYIQCIGAIGAPYLSLCFILLSLTGVAYWWGRFLGKHIEAWLQYPLGNFIDFYFILIGCHMVGYVMYQYHDALGLKASVSFESAQAKLEQKKEANPAIRELNTLVADGNFERAIDLLEIELRKDWDNNDTHDRYQKVLFAADKKTKAMEHARDFINKLINEKRFYLAIDLCEKWLKLDPTFKLNDSDQVYELAKATRMAKREKFALELMQDFIKKYPSHFHIPQMYLLSAQILSEVFHKDLEAMQALQTLLASYPEHSLVPEAKRFLVTLDKLSAIS